MEGGGGGERKVGEGTFSLGKGLCDDSDEIIFQLVIFCFQM